MNENVTLPIASERALDYPGYVAPDIHAMFVKEHGHLLDRPERLTHDQFYNGPQFNAWRECMDLVVGQIFHVELGYASYDEFPEVVYDMLICEMTDFHMLCDTGLGEKLTTNEDHMYYYRFVTLRSALDFINALVMAGDDSI